jgi:hypothetical protein
MVKLRNKHELMTWITRLTPTADPVPALKNAELARVGTVVGEEEGGGGARDAAPTDADVFSGRGVYGGEQEQERRRAASGRKRMRRQRPSQQLCTKRGFFLLISAPWISVWSARRRVTRERISGRG